MKLSILLVTIIFISSCVFAVFSWYEVLGDDYFKVDMVKNYQGNTMVSPIIPTSTVVSHIEEFKTKYVSSTKEQIEFEAKKDCEYYKAGIFCVKDLLGIVNAESGFNCKWVGDGHDAYGCFQINFHYHKDVTTGQAEDPVSATEWALLYLLRHHYMTSRYWAIMSFNGTPYTDTTLKYLKNVLNYK